MAATDMTASLPTFPRMCPLLEAPVARVLELSYRSEISDYGLSLYAWDPDGTAEVAELGGGLVVAMNDYLDPAQRVLLWSGGQPSKDHAATLLGHGPVVLVPTQGADTLVAMSTAEAQADESNADYVIDAADYVALRGRKFQNHRTALSWARRFDARLTVTAFGPGDEAVIDRIWDQWERHAGTRAKQAALERKGFARLRCSWPSLAPFARFETLVCEVGGRAEAIYLVEHRSERTAAGHYHKTSGIDPHLDLASFVLVAQHLASNGVTELNIMQDLGIHGLREHKQLLRPCRMVDKWIVSGQQRGEQQ